MSENTENTSTSADLGELSAAEAEMIRAMRQKAASEADDVPEYAPLLPYQRRRQATRSKWQQHDPRFNDALDDIERMALYIMGKQAMEFAYHRSTLYADGTDGMWAIFRSICEGIAEALPMLDMFELKEVAAQEDIAEDEADE